MAAPLAPDESARLAALHSLGVLYTPREETYDSIVDLAREIFNVPIAIITLLDRDCQWFKAVCGLSVDGTPRDQAFCAYTIQSDEPFIVGDALSDPRFCANPLVTGEPHIRFYAGVPLQVASGFNVGALCIIDRQPRQLDARQTTRLGALAKIAAGLLDQGEAARRLAALTEALAAEKQKLQRQNDDFELMSSLASIGVWRIDLDTMALDWSRQVRRIHEVDDNFRPDFESAVNFYDGEARDRLKAGLAACAKTLTPWDSELPMVTAAGKGRWVRLHASALAASGRATALFGAIQDVTGAVEARHALAVSTKRLELATESAAIGLWDWDVNADLFWTNPAWWRHLGFDLPPGARPDAEADTVIHPDDLAAVHANRAAFLAGNSPRLSNEFRHRDSNGGWRWILSMGRATANNPDGSIARISGVYVDIDERKQATDRVAYAARHDLMTGLVNRPEFERLVNEAIATQAAGDDFCIVAVDLDRFKHVNDTHGHAAGDAVLTEAARRLQSAVRGVDVVARLGGDEFALLLRAGPRCRQAATAIAQRMLSAFETPFLYDGHEVRVGASIGLAICPEHGRDFDTLLRSADAALYKVKAEGKNGFRFFHVEIETATQARRDLESGLRLALERGQFELHFQPQADLATGRIACCESLLFWHHPQHGLIAPDRFMPAAENSGLIVPIGQWLIAETCRLAAQWPDGIAVSINLSPAQLRAAGLVAMVQSALAASGLQPRRLEIEVAEAVFGQDCAMPLTDLLQLHDHGVRLALADFGSGLASLSLLQKLPFDRIKIGKSLIADLAANPPAAAIVCAVVNLAASLGIDSTAEGVDSSDLAGLVRAAGCKLGQGSHFGSPLPHRLVFRGNEASAIKVA